jgi:Transglycosylase SLT domain
MYRPRLALAALLLALATGRVAAQPTAEGGWSACRRAIAAAEPGSGLPPGLLAAIALVETGRAEPRSGRVEPWPWSWNAEGEGRAAPSREAAVAEVAALQARGVRSVDVGCMQVNLHHHPQAFARLEEGFDPAVNVRYAVRFLKELHARTGNWAAAVAQYHSGEAERGLAYHRRVVLARLGAAWGSGGVVPLPGAAGGGLCAPGLAPALAISAPVARRSAAARPRLVCRRVGAARATGPG